MVLLKENLEEKEKKALEFASGVIIGFLTGTVMIAFLILLLSVYPGTSHVAPGCVKPYIALDKNTVLVITHDEANLAPFYVYLQEHNIPYFIYNIDHAPYYLRYGDRNIPLMPPVTFVPAVICYRGNNLVGTTGYDYNLAIKTVRYCLGEVNG